MVGVTWRGTTCTSKLVNNMNHWREKFTAQIWYNSYQVQRQKIMEWQINVVSRVPMWNSTGVSDFIFDAPHITSGATIRTPNIFIDPQFWTAFYMGVGLALLHCNRMDYFKIYLWTIWSSKFQKISGERLTVLPPETSLPSSFSGFVLDSGFCRFRLITKFSGGRNRAPNKILCPGPQKSVPCLWMERD